jgi:hypothetical protein
MFAPTPGYNPTYAVTSAQSASLQPVLNEFDTVGWQMQPGPAEGTSDWSQIAMLAVVGTVAGAISARKWNKQTQTVEVEADVEAGIVSVLAGPAPVAALAVAAEAVAGEPEGEADSEEPPAPTALDDLKVLATQLNPVLCYFDPLGLSRREFWEENNEATIGWLRHSEIKHGRVCMFGFVGFIAHANGVHFPWKMPGDELCAPGVSPVALWEAQPMAAKLQIILTLGIFEWYSESAMSNSKGMGGHYMRGGKPGFFPPLKAEKGKGNNGVLVDGDGDMLLPHPVPLNLYDPFNFSRNKTDEQKARGLLVELNNGRLAMLGLMSFLAEGAIPGSVPALKGLIPETGEVNVMDPLNFARPLGALFQPDIADKGLIGPGSEVWNAVGPKILATPFLNSM